MARDCLVAERLGAVRLVVLALLFGCAVGALALRTADVLWPSQCDTVSLEQRVYVLETRLDGHEEDDAVMTYYALNGIE